MKLARDIMSLSTFKRDSNEVMRQMKKTKEPVAVVHSRLDRSCSTVVMKHSWIQITDSYKGLSTFRSVTHLPRPVRITNRLAQLVS